MKLHIDIDCFFVSAHRIGNPQLNNIPVAVGGRSNLSIFDKKNSGNSISKIKGAFTSSILSNTRNLSFEEYFMDENKRIRGIITTSSYEARAFGVKTAMSVSEALRWCPNLKVIPPNYQLYHELSHKLKELLQTEIPHIEQFSIDEFFGDVSGWIEEKDIVIFAQNLKNRILEETGLPVSIGISNSKWIAKLSTEFAKPYGVKYTKKEEIYAFTKDLPIKIFPGIGKGYQQKLESRNIKTLGDVRENKDLLYSWKKPGIQLYNRICGIDGEEISVEKSRKSIALARTFDPVFPRQELKRMVSILCRHLSFLSIKNNYTPLTFSLQIKYQYGSKAKDNIRTNRIFNEHNLRKEMLRMFDKCDIHPSHAVTRLTLSLSNFLQSNPTTMDIFHYEKDTKQAVLTKSINKLREKYGIDIIKNANEL
jgi:DNA polymerase-4